MERELRREISESSRGARTELTHTLGHLPGGAGQAGRRSHPHAEHPDRRLRAAAHAAAEDACRTRCRCNCRAWASRTRGAWPKCAPRWRRSSRQLQQTNAAKLDEMRKTVDEKLQTTLETRLGESFKQVADRLEQVHKGLGEMQTLAAGRGRPAARADQRQDARHVRRGAARGAARAGAHATSSTPSRSRPSRAATSGSTSRSAFPGRSGDGTPVWLPIDAKFPRDDYERLLDAQDRADPAAADIAARALEVAHPQRGQVDQRAATCARRTPPTSRSCSCRSKASMPRCCAAPA